MKKLSIQLTVEELQELVELVDNQMFRVKYIDPKIPGHRANPEKLRLAASAVAAVRETLNTAKGIKAKGAA